MWSNIEKAEDYIVEGNVHTGFSGRIVDKDSNTIYVIGMPLDNLGYSSDKEKTEAITKKNFLELMKVSNKSSNQLQNTKDVKYY